MLGTGAAWIRVGVAVGALGTRANLTYR
jgi:hypothetical protein